MKSFPKTVLNKLYNHTSLKNADGGVRFSVKNRLSPSVLLEVTNVAIDGRDIPRDNVAIACNQGENVALNLINPDNPIDFPLAALLTFHLNVEPLSEGDHDIEVVFNTQPFGQLKLEVTDALNTGKRAPGTLPRDAEDDTSGEIIQSRQTFIKEHTDVDLEHISSYSINPHLTRGNIEHFTGTAQIPMGFAGPVLVDGQHAKGEFYVPLATTEGTLVASYNRGMKVLHRSGGVKCTVVGDNIMIPF